MTYTFKFYSVDTTPGQKELQTDIAGPYLHLIWHKRTPGQYLFIGLLPGPEGPDKLCTSGGVTGMPSALIKCAQNVSPHDVIVLGGPGQNGPLLLISPQPASVAGPAQAENGGKYRKMLSNWRR